MITIVNLKTNTTGQVADHIGMDDKLLESQGYARIDVPQMPVYSEPSISQPTVQTDIFCKEVKEKKTRKPRTKKIKT